MLPWITRLPSVLDLLEVLETSTHIEASVLEVFNVTNPAPSNRGEDLSHSIGQLHGHGQLAGEVIQQVVEGQEAVGGDVDEFTLQRDTPQ